MQSSRQNLRRFHRPPCSGERRDHGRAFTVIELVIVMLVMGIMAAVATPTFIDSLLFHRVESAARRLKADLELARHNARLISAAQSLTVTDATYTLGAGVKDLDKPTETYVVDLKAPPYELDSVSASFNGDQVITFDGYGTPSSWGTIFLTNKRHQCIVQVDAATGEITITSNHNRARTAAVDN